MKKTQLKDAIRNIEKRLVSYLSICLVITLGLGGVLTTRYLSAGIEAETIDYYSDRNFKNFEMISSLGVTEEDLAEIKNVPGVSDVEGVIQADAILDNKGQKINVTLISNTERISTPELTQGEAPKGRNECMIGEDFAEDSNLFIGDKVRLSVTELKMGDPLYTTEFIITGLMHHPDYLRRKVENTVVLPMEAFNEEVTEGYYTRAFVKTATEEPADMLRESGLTHDREVAEALENLTLKLESEDQKRLQDEANEVIDEEWSEAEEKFKKADEELQKKEKELEKKLADSKTQLEKAEADLKAKIAEGEEELNAAEANLNAEVASYRQEIDNAEAAFAENIAWNNQLRESLGKAEEAKIQSMIAEIGAAQAALQEAEAQDQAQEDGAEAQVSMRDRVVRNLAQYIVDNADTFRIIHAIFFSERVQSITSSTQNYTGINIYDMIMWVGSFDIEGLISISQEYLNSFNPETGGDPAVTEDIINMVNEYKARLQELQKALTGVEYVVEEREWELSNARADLANKEAEGRETISNVGSS